MSNCKCVVFSDRAYNDIVVETKKKNPLETGGILLGHILDNGIWVVMEVLPPGPNSIFEYAYFEYDERFVNYLAQSKATEYEQELNLLGLWHRHPGSMDSFSGTDDGTNRIFARLNPQGAISGLVNVDPKFRLTMRHVSNPLQYEIVPVEVGDDLIPEEYFKLKYPSSQGLNPLLAIEKKNEQTNTGRDYAIGSTRKDGNGSKRRGVLVSFLDSKNVFFLLSLVLLTLALNNQWLHNKVQRANDITIKYSLESSHRAIDSVRQVTQKSVESLELDSEKRATIDKAVDDFVKTDRGEKAFKGIDCFVFCLWLFTVLSLLTALFLRKRDFFFSMFGHGGKKSGAWFERYPERFDREDGEIRARFNKA